MPRHFIEISMGGCMGTPLARSRLISVVLAASFFLCFKFWIRYKTRNPFYLLFFANKIKKAKPEKTKTPVKDSIKITSFGLSVGSYILVVSLFVLLLTVLNIQQKKTQCKQKTKKNKKNIRIPSNTIKKADPKKNKIIVWQCKQSVVYCKQFLRKATNNHNKKRDKWTNWTTT